MNGLIVQWGRDSVGTSGQPTKVTFSTNAAFSTTPVFIALSNNTITSGLTSTGAWTESYCNSKNEAYVYSRGRDALVSGAFSWFAIGY